MTLTEKVCVGQVPLYSGRYKTIKHLGNGTYGEVIMVENVHTGCRFALKKLRLVSAGSKYGLCPNAIREITILSQLNNPHVVSLKEVTFDESDSVLLVFELMRYDLRQFIQANQLGSESGLRLELVKNLGLQILIGVKHGHGQGVVHRDLKPQNILVDSEGAQAKVADWGLARKIGRYNDGRASRLLTREIVTLWYRPPEILLGSHRYGPEVDVWSLGVILFQMCTGKPLVCGPHAICTLLEIFQLFGTPFEDEFLSKLPFFSSNFPQWECRPAEQVLRHLLEPRMHSVPKELLSLLAGMLHLNPAERITVREAIRHPFFGSARASYLSRTRKVSDC